MKHRRLLYSDGGQAGNLIALLLGGAAAAGLILGAVLGLFGGLDLVGEPAQVASAARASYYDCPEGDPLGTVTRGDRVFITARDESGAWVQVRSPRAVNTRAWMRSIHVLPDSPIDDFPVLSCAVPVIAVVARPTTTVPETTTTTEAPEETTTTSAAPTTTATTAAPPTTNTTVPSDTTAPSISNAAASPGQIWEQDGLGITCPPANARSSTISASVTDGGGLSSVSASWTVPGQGTTTVTMSGGPNYTATFGPFAAGTWPDPPPSHVVTVTIRAEDTSENVATAQVQVTLETIGTCFI